MIITENVKLSDSILFLTIARQTLAEAVSKQNMKDFLINEASDYEIMSLLMTNKMPKEKYNIQSEMALFSLLKEQVLGSYNVLYEMIGKEPLNTFISEVGPVYPQLSTAKPLLEFFMNSHTDILNEKLSDHFSTNIFKGPNDKGFTGDELKRHEALKKKAAIMKAGKVGELKRKGMAMGKEALEKGVQKGQEIKGNVQQGVQQAKTSGTNALAAGKAAAEKGIGAVNKFATTPVGKAVGGLALAALLGYGAAKIYKNYFSAAAKQCSGAPDKAACMRKFKQDALRKQIAGLNSSMSACRNSSNPQKCTEGIKARIQKLNDQITKA